MKIYEALTEVSIPEHKGREYPVGTLFAFEDEDRANKAVKKEGIKQIEIVEVKMETENKEEESKEETSKESKPGKKSTPKK